MSSLTRMLSVLDLFSREHETMSADEIADTLQLTRTTCYRYTRELTSAGLLVSNGGRFTLGPRIIQLDHRIRQSDPLLNAARDVLVQLAAAVGAGGLLATIYKSEIINIFQCGDETLHHLTYGRGTSVPTFRGSSSKVILAALSRARLRRIWADNETNPDCLAIGADWLAFWQALQAIKKNGFWISRSELDSTLVGMAAPVFYGAEGDVAGSMTLIFRTEEFGLFDADALGARLLRAAAEVSQSLSPR